jgi:glycogen synthase
MKILLVPSAYLPSIGGVQHNTHELAKQLSEMGHEVIVLTSNWRGWRLPRKETIDTIQVYRLPFYVFRGTIKSLIAFSICFPLALIGTIRVISKFKPDVINVHFLGSNAFYILLAHYFKKKPLMVTFHGNEVITVPDPTRVGAKGYTRLETKWMNWTIASILRRADYVTAVSEYLLNNAKKLNSAISEKSTRIFMGGFKDGQDNTRSSQGNKPFILAVGRLATEKGFDLLIAAVRFVSEKIPSISLIIIGDGPEKAELLKLIEQNNLQDKVILKGFLPKEQIGDYYRKCLFLVVPSMWEGLGSIIFESAMYKKPVVATSVGGIPENVIDGVTGLLVEPGNVTQLSDAIMRLLLDPKLCNEIGNNAKKFIDERGDWTKIATGYCQIYQNIISEQNREKR